MQPFVINVADLVHRPSARRSEYLSGPTAEMVVTETIVPNGATLHVNCVIEAVSDGVLATGDTRVEWEANCRRCLVPITGLTSSSFREMYSANPVEGETYPIRHDCVDLELVAREAILLDLPLAPLCGDDCLGLCPTCGADRNEGPCACEAPVTDHRWTALDGLKTKLADEVPSVE
jgi:uncharacterized protein